MALVHLLGVASTPRFRPGGGPGDLAREALAAALDDAGVSADQIDGVAIAATDRAFVAGAEAVLGETRRDYNCRCGLGPVALDSAWKAVSAGVVDVVACIGFDRGGPRLPLDDDRSWLEAQAAAARELLQHSGAEERHLAQVAAKNLRQGAEAPGANVVAASAEEVLASETLLWPLRQLMIAPPAHGASAIVLSGVEPSPRRGPKAPVVRASVMLDGSSNGGAETSRAARLAYFSAEVGPEEIDLAEIEDPTPVEEIAAYEPLEFAPEGAAVELVESGFTALGGVLPVNAGGGALCQGFSRGTGGIRQLVELSVQLRGRAGRRQVPGARLGLALSGGPANPGGPTGLTIVSA
ncbi:MAG TPA: thiolase family protein [Solirubrobacterales bacterium]|nr:thiolase family protein [Solirubrobacterales bacterium]